MQESITQKLLAGVLAGQTLYENFVGETRARLDSGADIERGPLTVDFEALRAEGVPLRIIVPTPGFWFHKYSLAAQGARIQGTVVLQIVINEKGVAAVPPGRMCQDKATWTRYDYTHTSTQIRAGRWHRREPRMPCPLTD